MADLERLLGQKANIHDTNLELDGKVGIADLQDLLSDKVGSTAGEYKGGRGVRGNGETAALLAVPTTTHTHTQACTGHEPNMAPSLPHSRLQVGNEHLMEIRNELADLRMVLEMKAGLTNITALLDDKATRAEVAVSRCGANPCPLDAAAPTHTLMHTASLPPHSPPA